MRLEVGMYVRTKISDNCNCVYIRKITEIDDERYFFNQICVDEDVVDGWGDERIWIDVEDISKASHNIIDLIEVGDYVNGLLVTRICEDNETNKKYINLYGSISEWEEDDIKSIVTKEQFECISYMVGE